MSDSIVIPIGDDGGMDPRGHVVVVLAQGTLLRRAKNLSTPMPISSPALKKVVVRTCVRTVYIPCKFMSGVVLAMTGFFTVRTLALRLGD